MINVRIFRRQVSGILYLIDLFGRSIPIICIASNFLLLILTDCYRGTASVYTIPFLSRYVKALLHIVQVPDSLFSFERP